LFYVRHFGVIEFVTDNDARPTLFILAGPNGAGKSTLYETVVKPRIKAPFINADIIQRDELKDSAMEAAYTAAKIAETRRAEYIAERKSFVAESTFSHPSKLDLITQAQTAGFRVVTYHVNVRSPNLSVARVANRVTEGGHDVPEEKIRKRYELNQPLIREAILKSDYAFVYDNSVLNKPPRLAMSFQRGRIDRVSNDVPAWARELYSKELEHFSPSRLNPAANSFEEAQKIVLALGGDDARLSIPGKKASHFAGPIVGESSLHWVQQIEQKTFVAHFKTALPKETAINAEVSINYISRSDATIRPLSVNERFESTLARSGFTDAEKTKARDMFQKRLTDQSFSANRTKISVNDTSKDDRER
jgi:predicted ABC-type ATPase